MKVHFEITEGKKSHFITLLTRSQVTETSHAGVTVDAVKDSNGKWIVANFNMLRPSKENSAIIRSLDNLHHTAFESPVALLAALEDEGGRQVVYDKRLKKFRNISTMKDDKNMYVAVGTDISVPCDDEDLAERRLSTMVTKAMIKNPEEATTLAEWFAKGRKVKLLESGEVPGHATREIFANKGEATAQKKTIKKMVAKKSKK